MKKIILIGLLLLVLIPTVFARPASQLSPNPPVIPPQPQPTPHSHSRSSTYLGTFESCVRDNTYLHIFRDLTPYIKAMDYGESTTLRINLFRSYYVVNIEKKHKCDYGLRLVR